MDCSIDTLPDEVLAVILKLAADSPVLAWLRKPPFPVTVQSGPRHRRPSHWTLADVCSPVLEHQVEQLREFLKLYQSAASQLQSAHISLVDWNSEWNYREELPPLAQLFGIASLRSFRANRRLDLIDFTVFRAVQSLDIDCGDLIWHPHTLRPILGPLSPLRTLVIRNFYPQLTPLADPSRPPPYSPSPSASADRFSTAATTKRTCSGLRDLHQYVFVPQS
ncbi:hypothetical protein B0H13DRAFT_1865675 [Mycena leptocephala]|nr:hypothetical protein B0H13DRAFT_1865675 [Mycena leptocephala]